MEKTGGVGNCGCAGVGDIIFLSERAECAVKKKCTDFMVCVEKVLPNATVEVYSGLPSQREATNMLLYIYVFVFFASSRGSRKPMPICKIQMYGYTVICVS